MQFAGGIDKDRFTGGHIGNQLKANHVQGNTFRGHHIFDGAVVRNTLAIDQGANTIGIAKGNHAQTADQRDHTISPTAATMDPGNREENILGFGFELGLKLQFMGKYVEQDL